MVDKWDTGTREDDTLSWSVDNTLKRGWKAIERIVDVRMADISRQCFRDFMILIGIEGY